MVATILQSGTTPAQLSALVNYISFNADYEWEQGSRQSHAGIDPNIREGTRYERHQANTIASTVLSVLLKARPINLDLISSLASCCGGPQAVLSWILSTLVNTFDDEMRSVGIRCLVDYMDSIVSKADALQYTVQDDAKDEGRASGHEIGKTSRRMAEALTGVGKSLSTARGGHGDGLRKGSGLAIENATRRVSVTLTNVGKTLSTAIGGQMMLPAKAVSLEIVYKLLWHLLKSHRARMGRKTHMALNYMLVEGIGHLDTTESLMEQLVVPDTDLHIGYRLNLKRDQDLLLEIESVAGKRLRKNMGINMVLRLLRFLPSTWKDNWLLELVTSTRTCTSNIQILVEDPDWQPSLFHVISDCIEDINTKYNARATLSGAMDPTETADGAHFRADLSDEAQNSKEVRSEVFGAGEQSISTPDDHVQLQARFNLSLKLYCTLLGYCFRQGGEKVRSGIGSCFQTKKSTNRRNSGYQRHRAGSFIGKGLRERPRCLLFDSQSPIIGTR